MYFSLNVTTGANTSGGSRNLVFENCENVCVHFARMLLLQCVLNADLRVTSKKQDP